MQINCVDPSLSPSLFPSVTLTLYIPPVLPLFLYAHREIFLIRHNSFIK